MKFGVIIRSIGENTENLCKESVKNVMPDAQIHIVKNISPAHDAYIHMFNIALKENFDWFLALDADVVLAPNWHKDFLNVVNTENTDKTYKISFDVKDFITQSNLCRGNHFYNGKLVKMCLMYIKINKWISKQKYLRTRIGKYLVNPGYYLKPESTLITHFKRHNINAILKKNLIGYHAYEQSDEEIVRQMIVRYARGGDYLDRYLKESHQDYKHAEELKRQRSLAFFAFNEAKNIKDYKMDALEMKHYVEKIIQKYNKEKEKKKIKINRIDDFLKKYKNDL